MATPSETAAVAAYRAAHPFTPVAADPHTDTVTVSCGRCGGAGTFPSSPVTFVSGGVEAQWCFECHGAGGRTWPVAEYNRRARQRWLASTLRAVRAAAKAEADRAAAAAAAAEVELLGEERLTAYAAAHPAVAAVLENDMSSFVISLRDRIRRGEDLTEGQAAALERVAAEAALPVSDVPSGRVVVTGVIRSLKWVEGRFSYYASEVAKVTVRDDSGFRVFGTLPAALDGAVVGDRVTFTAALTASNDDPSFGFFSRPTKAARA